MGVPAPEAPDSDDLKAMIPLSEAPLGSWVRVVHCTNHEGHVGRVIGGPRRVVVGDGGVTCAALYVKILPPEEVALLVLAQ